MNSHDWQIKALVYALVYFAIFIVLLRVGLVATITAVFFINSFNALTLGLDLTTWYAPYGLATLTLLLSIAVVAFWKSLGAGGLLGNEAAETT